MKISHNRLLTLRTYRRDFLDTQYSSEVEFYIHWKKKDLNYKIASETSKLSGAEIELVGMFTRESILKDALSNIMGKYKYIIIDTPPSLGLLTVNVLTASKSLIIPIQCEYYALEGLSQLLNTIRLIQKNLNPDLNIEGI